MNELVLQSLGDSSKDCPNWPGFELMYASAMTSSLTPSDPVGACHMLRIRCRYVTRDNLVLKRSILCKVCDASA